MYIRVNTEEIRKRSDIKAPKASLTKLMLPSKPLYLQTVAEIDIVTSQETLFSYYAELTFDLMSMPLTASPQTRRTLTPTPTSPTCAKNKH